MNRYHQQNRCTRRFHDAGAVSPGITSALDQVGVRDSLVFRYLRSRGVIVDVGGGRFHLEPDAERKFRQRRFVFTASGLAVGLIVIVFLVLFAMSRAAETPSADNAVTSPIQVVRTWQDLLDQPAIRVGTGTARLGIEAQRAPCMGGVLLYCLTEGCSLPREWQEGNRFGPFQVEIRHETDTAGQAVEARSMLRQNPPDMGNSTVLFRKAIPLDRPGIYHVRVCSAEGTLLAETEVTATREAGHPWMPLEPGARGDEERGGFDAVGSVRNRAKGIAIPRFDGMEPMLFRSDGPDTKIRRLPGDPLPTLVPEDAGAVLTVKASGTDLVVESKVNIILARPDWHFLARWWVNDKPYIPAQLDNFSDANGQVTIGRRLLLHLDFDPRRLAAAPGDMIDLQLLYCKNGWELVQPGHGLLHARLDAEGPELLLSNRIRIVRGKDGMEGHASLKSTIMDVFLTGREQAIIDMIAKKTVEPVPDRFPNALDHALAVLLANGCPKPDATRLVRATVESLVKEFERETNGKTGATQQETWVSTISRSKRFDSILKELVALNPHDANQNRLLEAGLNGMCGTMGSGAACVLSKDQAEEFKKLVNARKTATEEPGLVGLRLHRWPVVDVMPGGPAAEAGLRNGDVVVAVNGNEAVHARTAQDASKILQGPPGSMVKLVAKRDSTTLTFDLTRAFAAAARVEARQVEPHVLLLTIPTFEGSGIADRVKRLVRTRTTDQTTAIILDLRDNPGGRAEEANAVADVFLDGRLLQICAFRNGRRIAFRSNPGVLSTARVILLTNNNTASAAEMLAMALRDNSRAAIVGEQTAGALFGKDLVELAGGKAIFFRTEPTVLSPTGNDHSRSGIPPDLRVRDLRSKEKDDILLQALELAKNGGKEHDNPN